MNATSAKIRWSRRVSPQKIRRLYESDARGMLDEELLDDVGYGIYVRCRDLLEVATAFRGKVKCRSCEHVILRQGVEVGPVGDKTEMLTCDRCSWQTTWGAYHKSLSGKSLHACGCEGLFESYVQQWPSALSSHEKLLLIDRLIHEFHVFGQGSAEELGAPVGRNVIAATGKAVTELINELAYGTGSTAGLQETRRLWSLRLGQKESTIRKSDLQAIARKLGIKGRSHMRKAELISAIEAVDPKRLE